MRTIAIFVFIHKPPSPLPRLLLQPGRVVSCQRDISKGTLEE